MLQKSVTLLGIFPELRDTGFNITHIAKADIVRTIDLVAAHKVIEDGGGLVKKQREVRLNPRRRNSGTHILVDRTARWVSLKILPPAPSKGGARGLIKGKLMTGQ